MSDRQQGTLGNVVKAVHWFLKKRLSDLKPENVVGF